MKKIIALLLVVVLSVSIGVGGTLAYLKDQASNYNTMVYGNVNIEQWEYERELNADGTYKKATVDNTESYVLKGYAQDKPLFPIVGDPNEPGNSPAYAGYDAIPVRMSQVNSYGGMQVFAGKNAQDKFVVVKNSGTSDAYIRTFVAFEVGSGDANLIMSSYHQTWKSKTIGTLVINNVNYKVVEYDYVGGQLSDGSWRHENGILPAGDTAYPSLSQVYLKHNAEGEDCTALDGNKNGKCDILVLSQAVQTAGFETAADAFAAAFPVGENNANLIAWLAAVK